MEDYKGPLTSIDVRNTGFIGMDTLNKANVGPINQEKGWLVLWQKGRKDEIGNDVPASVSNVAILEKEHFYADDIKIVVFVKRFFLLEHTTHHS